MNTDDFLWNLEEDVSDRICFFDQWRRCEEATEVDTHHRQSGAPTMGVAEDETPSSLTSHPNANPNNPTQEGQYETPFVYSRSRFTRTDWRDGQAPRSSNNRRKYSPKKYYHRRKIFFFLISQIFIKSQKNRFYKSKGLNILIL